MNTVASQITSLTIVYSTIYSGADQRKHQSSPSLALVWGIHRGPVNSPHRGPVTRKMFPFDDVIMRFSLFWWQVCACNMSSIMLLLFTTVLKHQLSVAEEFLHPDLYALLKPKIAKIFVKSLEVRNLQWSMLLLRDESASLEHSWRGLQIVSHNSTGYIKQVLGQNLVSGNVRVEAHNARRGLHFWYIHVHRYFNINITLTKLWKDRGISTVPSISQQPLPGGCRVVVYCTSCCWYGYWISRLYQGFTRALHTCSLWRALWRLRAVDEWIMFWFICGIFFTCHIQ